MNILVTGGAGFIGTHLTRRLLAEGHSVTILDKFVPQVHGAGRELAADLRPHVRVVRGDVADLSALESALSGAECVVHLAAETGTGQSMYEVARYERTNLSGTALICEMLTKSQARKIERLIVASSRAIYGEGAYHCVQHGLIYPRARTTAEKRAGHFDPLCPLCGGQCGPVPTPENAPFQPSSFYGLTKQTQEQMILMFGGVLGIPSFALRYQNVFGPGQSLHNPYTGILAIFSNLARSGHAIQIFEDGRESRDFVYVEDVVQATASCLASSLSGCEALNIGSGSAVTVLDVATSIDAFFGSRSRITVTGAFREGDIRHGSADLTKVRDLLGYEPKWSFEAGLRSFLSWAMESEISQTGYEQSLAELKQRGLMSG